MRLRTSAIFLLWVSALLWCSGQGWSARSRPTELSPRALFDQLNDLAVDPAQIYVLRGAQISRDRVNIYFNQGFIGFLGKAGGEITGAVFAGEGEVLLLPPNLTEKASLATFTQSPVLEENFSFAYLRFTDQTAKQLMAMARPPDPQDLDQPTGFAEQWNPLVQRLNPNFSVRVLEDLLGARDLPYFQAHVQGVNLGLFTVAVDERAPEAVTLAASRTAEGRTFTDIWSAFPSRVSEARSAALTVGPIRVRSYKIDTRITAANSLEGHAELEVESQSSADRILVFLLSNRLRVSDVRDAAGRKLEFFQSPPFDAAGGVAGGDDWVAVALPSPVPAGSRSRLTFKYQGNVITDVGNGVLYVGARGSWYPNRGTNDPALYDLTFQYPRNLTLVATGNRVTETSQGDTRTSRWTSEGALRIAGFNLGPYDSRVRHAGKTTIEVYATPEAESALEKLHVASRPPSPAVILQRGRFGILVPAPVFLAPLVPAALLDGVAENAAGAVKYFEQLFGPFPYARLAIAQIPGNFGQGWPELVYLPTLSFLGGPERAELGRHGKTAELSDESMVPHEIAHQWWGNEVGWKTDHDQWLSEGFASYAAVLYLTQEKGGDRKARELLQSYKHDLLDKTPEGKTVESGGPIWLGRRLSNSLNPEGYNHIVYKKACWVLHMLHALMTEPATGSDARFFIMLREFVAAYRDASPSTEDFMRHAAKYMTPTLDLDHNRRLDWFFADWVYGTGIPSYKLSATTRRLTSGSYVIQGTIEQSGVPADFQMLVPVAAYYGKDRKVALGQVAVTDSRGRFKFSTTIKPSRVSVDEDNLLAVIK